MLRRADIDTNRNNESQFQFESFTLNGEQDIFAIESELVSLPFHFFLKKSNFDFFADIIRFFAQLDASKTRRHYITNAAALI